MILNNVTSLKPHTKVIMFFFLNISKDILLLEIKYLCLRSPQVKNSMD